MRLAKAPGVLAYATILMWFLLTVLAPARGNAEEPAVVAVRAADLLPDIEAALSAKGLAPGAEIELAEPGLALFLAESGAPAFESVSFNPGSGRFLIRARDARDTHSIAGFARALVALPVLAQPIARGDVIAEDDVTWLETTTRVGGVVLDAVGLVGMEARRALPAGAPVRVHDVAAPLLVKRGALVTIAFETEGLRLTHAGVAMSDGAEGALIDVKNVKSDRVVKAVVSGPNLVAAVSTRRIATAGH